MSERAEARERAASEREGQEPPKDEPPKDERPAWVRYLEGLFSSKSPEAEKEPPKEPGKKKDEPPAASHWYDKPLGGKR